MKQLRTIREALSKEQLEAAVWKVFEYQADVITPASSLRQEEAENLLRSIAYTLGSLPEDDPLSGDGLLRDPIRTFRRAQEILEDRRQYCLKLLRSLQRLKPALCCHALEDTLASLEQGLLRYPMQEAAHEVPGLIDYQLLVPLPEELEGLHYVQPWLERLMAEFFWLRRYPAHTLESWFDRRLPGGCADAMELMEPVLTAGLVHALAGEVFDLTDREPIGPDDLPEMLSTEQLTAALDRLMEPLQIPRPASFYFPAAVPLLLPRLQAAAENGMLHHLG